MIKGRTGVCLCNECIRDFSSLLDDYSWTKNDSKKQTFALIRPHEMKKLLDRVVVGQEKAKKALSVAIYNHELFISGKLRGKYRKNNILMVGPTGVGKTFLVENIAKIIDVPILICDATTYSEVGYVGDDVNHILELLYYQSGNDIQRVEKAIVFLDEIDKLASRDTVHSYGRDVSGVGVQQALLKMIEGKIVSFETTTERGIKKTISIDTTNILFVFSGAFVGMQKAGSISFSLEKYGMLPEFIGRSYCFVQLENLDREDLFKIMSQIDSSVCSIFKELFSVDGIDLEFDNAALYRIADICIEMRLGARGLYAIMNDLLFDIRYEAIMNKEKKIVITESFVDSVLH